METSVNPEVSLPVPRKRPFVLTLLCIASFVYFGLISLALLFSLFYTGSLRDLLNTYIVGHPVSTFRVFAFLLMLLVMYASAFTGTLFMWKMKRAGYYLFAIPVLAISVYQLFQAEIPVFSTGILITLLILFGLFYKRFH